MEDKLNKLNKFWIKLIVFTLYWIAYIIYNIVRCKNGQEFNTFGFIYSCVLFLPFTILILIDKFQIAYILIIILFFLNSLTAFGDLIRNLNSISKVKMQGVHYFSLVYSLVNLITYISLIVLAVIKLKRDIEIKENDNKTLILVCIGMSILKIIFAVINVIVVMGSKNNGSELIFSMLYNTVLFIYQSMYVICAKKTELMVKDIDLK